MWPVSEPVREALKTTITRPGPHVIHDCPADGTEHENSDGCVCGPTRLPDDEHGNQHWQHHS